MKKKIRLMLAFMILLVSCLNNYVYAEGSYINVDYLTKYYWAFDGGNYTEYKFDKNGTYTEYDYNGNIYSQGNKYTLNDNVLTFYDDWGTTQWFYTSKYTSDVWADSTHGDYIFLASYDKNEIEAIFNTGKEVPNMIGDADEEISVILNGCYLSFDQPPIILNDRTLVPVRAIFEALGATVDWGNNTVTARRNGTIISIGIGDNYMRKNSERIALDVPARIVNDRTLVPVRAIAEAFDCDVTWDGDSRSVIIQDN